MMKQSEFVWRIFPFMRWLQFPYRLNTIIVLSATALTGLAFANLSPRRNRISLSLIILSLFGWLAAGVVSADQAFSMWRHIPPERVTSNAEIVQTQMEPLPFWPKPARANELRELPAFKRFISENPPKAVAFAADGSGDLMITSWHPRQIELKVRCLVAGHIILNHFYYSGWRALREDTEGTIFLEASQPNGFMELTAPPGRYSVLIRLPADQAEQQGRLIGLFSLFACAGLVVWEYCRSRQTLSLPYRSVTTTPSEISAAD
jgi:hypothetical protein